MEEPLVDTVNNQSLITKGTQFFEFDINTVTKEQLSIKRKFELQAIDNDYCHAFIVYWDAVFPGKQRVILPTGPMHQYTHWKQTVFYMDQVLDLKKGDTINGEITAVPSKINPRELDIDISWEVKTQANDKSRELKGGYTYFLR